MLINFEELFNRYSLFFHGVLHIGANVGEEFAMYNKLGINKQIWIEGNPEIYLKLKENIASNPLAVAHNYIIGAKDLPEVTLHISNNGSQSSSVLDLKVHKNEHPDVYYVKDIRAPQFSISTLVKDGVIDLYGVDLLNIDLQGYDLQALIGMGALLLKFKAVYIEVNKAELYGECAQIDEVDVYMHLYGFDRVETKWAKNKSWGDAFYVKRL